MCFKQDRTRNTVAKIGIPYPCAAFSIFYIVSICKYALHILCYMPDKAAQLQRTIHRCRDMNLKPQANTFTLTEREKDPQYCKNTVAKRYLLQYESLSDN